MLLTLPDELLLDIYVALADDRPAATALRLTCHRLWAVTGDMAAFRRFAARQPVAVLHRAWDAILQRAALPAEHVAKLCALATLLPATELPRAVRALVRTQHLDRRPPLVRYDSGVVDSAAEESSCEGVPRPNKDAAACLRAPACSAAAEAALGPPARLPSTAARLACLLVETLQALPDDLRTVVVNEALEDAVAIGSRPAVDLMLEFFGSSTDLDLAAALLAGANRGQACIMRRLLACGAAPSAAALLAAAENGHASAVLVLLEHGAAVGGLHDAALRAAASEGHATVVRLLLQAGADVHALDDAALREAARNGHVDTIQLLLRFGAWPQARRGEALRWAAAGGHLAAVELLLRHQPDNRALADAIRASAAVGYRGVVRALAAHAMSSNVHASLWTFSARPVAIVTGRVGVARPGDLGWAAEDEASPSPAAVSGASPDPVVGASVSSTANAEPAGPETGAASASSA